METHRQTVRLSRRQEERLKTEIARRIPMAASWRGRSDTKKNESKTKSRISPIFLLIYQIRVEVKQFGTRKREQNCPDNGGHSLL